MSYVKEISDEHNVPGSQGGHAILSTHEAVEIAARGKWRSILLTLERVFRFILCAQFAAITAIVTAAVIARYGFNRSFPWSEELSAWTLVSLVFTGMAVGHASNHHIALDVTGHLQLPRWVQPARLFAVDAIVTLTILMLLAGGMGIIEAISGPSIALGVDVRIRYIVVPFGCIASLVFIALSRLAAGRSWAESILPIVVGGVLFVASGLGELHVPGLSPTLIMWCTFAATVFLGVPIAYAMLLASFLSSLGGDLLPMAGLVSTMVEGTSSFIILAIPFFLAAGYLMDSGGMADRLIAFANALVGHFRGGMAQANVIQSLMLGGISGSASADTASTTKIMVPQMNKLGYSPPFSCAVTVVSSMLPAIIPPSIALLIYASVSNVSVAQLFTAAIVPGFLLCAVMMVVVKIIAEIRHYEKSPSRAPARVLLRTGLGAMPGVILAIAILGMLRAGIMTATEVAVVAMIWAFIFGKFVYRRLSARELYEQIGECATATAIVIFIVAVSHPFAWVMLAEQLPQDLIIWLTALVEHKWQMLLLVNLIAFTAGCLLEIVPSILILGPLLTPLLSAMGVDPIHAGIIIMMNLQLATVAPPLGVQVFICSSISGVPVQSIFRECLPFIAALFVPTLIITYFPDISLFLWTIISH